MTTLPSVTLIGWLPLCVFCMLSNVSENACPRNCSCDQGTHVSNCTDASLTYFPWNLPDPNGVEQLIMRHNRLQALSGRIATYPNLRLLDFSGNQLTRIEPAVFDGLQHMETLELQENSLTRIGSRALEQQITSLLDLDLSNNELTAIEDGAFRDLVKLEQLKLANNKLTGISSAMLRGLVSLRFLFLNNNRLSYLNPKVFEQLNQLHTLVLDMNNISSFPMHIFQNLTHLRRLSLEGNGIGSLPIVLFSTESDPPLEELSLKNNKFFAIPGATLRRLVNLRVLDLSHNPFGLVDPDTFEGLDQLESLIISNCPELVVIRDYSFTELFSLHTVEISSNPKLETIEKNAFISSHNLKEVRLKDNALTTVDVDLLQWSNLDSLALGGNPWTCDCTLSFLGEVLEENLNRSSRTSSAGLYEARCSLPESVAGESVLDLTLTQFQCQATIRPESDSVPEISSTIMIAIICTFAGALLTCLGFLLWRTRHQNFHTDPRNHTNYRRRRLRKINREFSVESNIVSEGPRLVSVPSMGSASDRPFAAEGPLDGACLEDDVFGNAPDIVTSSQTAERCRRVSFADKVAVRTYEYFDDQDESCDSSDLMEQNDGKESV